MFWYVEKKLTESKLINGILFFLGVFLPKMGRIFFACIDYHFQLIKYKT